MHQTQSTTQKKANLLHATQRLKEEFFGLDQVIDEIIYAITPWYLHPDWQFKPVVINLWGMTGTGKTSLVTKLLFYLELDTCLYQLDPYQRNHSSNVFGNIKNARSEQPKVFMLDEFQYWRTKDEKGREQYRHDVMIWQLLDEGIWQDDEYQYQLPMLKYVISRMEMAISQGFTSQNGFVVQDPHAFLKVFEMHQTHVVSGEIGFLPKQYWEYISDIAGMHFHSFTEWMEFAAQADEKQQLAMLKDLYQTALQPVKVDCRSSLIFVIGNLDEVYPGTHDMRGYLRPDVFCEAASRITLEDIKKGLLVRFRAEQVARLGNTHILYPPISEETFRNVIRKRLIGLGDFFFSKAGVELEFHQSIEELVYSEGVIPSQGIRPLLSTIHHMVWPSICRYASDNEGHLSDHCEMQYHREEGAFRFLCNGQLSIYPFTPSSENRKRDVIPTGDRQLIAVHEAGHILGLSLLDGTLPDHVYNRSHRGQLHAELLQLQTPNLLTRDDILRRAAILLGGWVAEGLVYGINNRTIGCESDLSRAADTIMKMLWSSGLDGNPFVYRSLQEGEHANPTHILDIENKLYDRCKEILREAEGMMEMVLHEHPEAFRALAKAISMTDYMDKADLERILTKNGVIIGRPLAEDITEEREALFNDWLVDIEPEKSINL